MKALLGIGFVLLAACENNDTAPQPRHESFETALQHAINRHPEAANALLMEDDATPFTVTVDSEVDEPKQPCTRDVLVKIGTVIEIRQVLHKHQIVYLKCEKHPKIVLDLTTLPMQLD